MISKFLSFIFSFILVAKIIINISLSLQRKSGKRDQCAYAIFELVNVCVFVCVTVCVA